MMLQIRNLRASVGGKEILRGLDLDVRAGEVHADRKSTRLNSSHG